MSNLLSDHQEQENPEEGNPTGQEDTTQSGALVPDDFFVDDVEDEEAAVYNPADYLTDPNHKCGYVAIAGLPNAGKSTLLNTLLGEKLSITTPKPQTTRKTILGILNDPMYQIVFLDTPGILVPQYLLQEKMSGFISSALKDADVALFLLDAEDDAEGEKLYNHPGFVQLTKKLNIPVLLLINKIDTLPQARVNTLIEFHLAKGLFRRVVPVSALHKFNIPVLLSELLEYLPVHPKYFPEDIIAADTERFFVTEIIRGKILELYQDEIPYSAEVQIEEFKEVEGRKDFISATITVERDTQKGIVIGARGSAIKQLSEYSRKHIEEFLGRPVFLELRVRVKEKWRNNAAKLRQFGYE